MFQHRGHHAFKGATISGKSTENHDSKLIWKTSKQLLNLNKHSSDIPTLNMNIDYAETDQKVEILNLYCSSQTRVNDTNKNLLIIWRRVWEWNNAMQ